MLIRRLDMAPESARLRATGGVGETYVEYDGAGALILGEGDAPRTRDEVEVRLLFASGRTGAAGGPWLFHVGLWTPPEFRDEFLAWYAVEHLPILLECRLWDGCRFVEQAVADGCQFYAMHQLSDAAALQSEQRKVSRSTPWFLRLKAHDWFDERFVRTLYRRSSGGASER